MEYLVQEKLAECYACCSTLPFLCPQKLDQQRCILDSTDTFRSTLEDEISSPYLTGFEQHRQLSGKLRHPIEVGIEALTED